MIRSGIGISIPTVKGYMSIRLKGHATEGSVSGDLGILSLLVSPVSYAFLLWFVASCS
jgi:hypothetical protein